MRKNERRKKKIVTERKREKEREGERGRERKRERKREKERKKERKERKGEKKREKEKKERLQSVLIRSNFLLVNLHIVQFQFGLQFLRLSHSQFVQSFQDFIMRDFRH